jgi:hypothetical protein
MAGSASRPPSPPTPTCADCGDRQASHDPGLLPTITRRLTRLLDDIAAIAPAGRRPGLDKRRTQIAPPA